MITLGIARPIGILASPETERWSPKLRVAGRSLTRSGVRSAIGTFQNGSERFHTSANNQGGFGLAQRRVKTNPQIPKAETPAIAYMLETFNARTD